MLDEKAAHMWLRQAASDLESAEVLLKASKYDACCFMAEQSAQKALKAFLLAHKKRVPLTHSLLYLYQECCGEGLQIEELEPALKHLTRYYVEARYPDAANAPPVDIFQHHEAENAVTAARKLLSHIKRLLEQGSGEKQI